MVLYLPRLGKDVITGMHIVNLMDGQILRTRTIARLTREDHFKLEEFKKFKVAIHESGVQHKEDSYDQMLFKDLVRNFLLQQRNQVTFGSSEIDSRVFPLYGFPSGFFISGSVFKEYLALQDYLNLNLKFEGESLEIIFDPDSLYSIIFSVFFCCLA